MNESLPPDGRRVSYKSLDSEAMAAARRAAEASGISLQEWLSRTILENARKSGIVPDSPSREVAGPAGQPNAEDAVQAIARHLERAKSAADSQGLSLAEWLSRAILTNAHGGESVSARRALADAKSTPPATELPPGRGNAPATPPRTEGPASTGSRFRTRTAAAVAAEKENKDTDEVALPEASSVRDVLARGGQRSAANPPAAAAEGAPARRRRTAPLWAALGVLVLVAGGIWALPLITKSLRGGETQDAAAPPNNETAALPDARPADARPADAKPGEAKPPEPPKAEAAPPKPPEVAKPAEKPPAATPPAAKPPEKAEAVPGGTPAPPPTAKPESKTPEKPLPEPGDDLAKVPAKDMPKPPAAHVDWYKKAAEAENPEAQYALAELYLKGDGVGRDYRQAAQLFRRAAEKGNLSRAQYALGLLYQRGLGVPKNDVEAVLWWQKAADQNFMPAITWVGLSLLEGRGIQKDEEAARKMLERAAEGDEPNAQYTLGRIYERGMGTKKDPVVAMKWFILAAEQAHPQATQKVEELSTSLARDLQERATELVSEHYRRFRRRT